MMSPYIIGGIVTFLSWIVRQRFQSVMNSLSKIPLSQGFTGKEVAEAMLHANGIHDVKVVSVGGMLTDHYNPTNKTVNLSEAVYSQRNITSTAVAAHEVGHAVQHATSYSFLQMRSKLVPVVNIASKFSTWVLLAGIALIEMFPAVMLAGLCLLAASTLFSLVTLPVEFDASKRALDWLESSNVTRGDEHDGAKKGLKWAAMTYVVAALGSLGVLFYYLRIYLSRR